MTSLEGKARALAEAIEREEEKIRGVLRTKMEMVGGEVGVGEKGRARGDSDGEMDEFYDRTGLKQPKAQSATTSAMSYEDLVLKVE